jgi:hypothetical protein
VFAASLGRCVLTSGVASLLRFNPDIPHGQLQLCPMIPDRLLPVRLENVPLAGTRMSITVESENGVDVRGLPEGVRLLTTPP